MQRAYLGLLITGSCLFFSMGSALAMYGPIFPELRAMFGLDAADAGALASAHFVGAFAGIVLWSLGERRGVARLMLTGSAVLLALGPLLIATAPSFAFARAGAALLGVGYGSSTLGVHRLFAVLHGDRATGPLNLVNAVFGFSAIVGPLAVGMVAGPARQYLFAGPALLALITVPLALASPGMPAQPAQEPGAGASRGDGRPAARGRGDRLTMVLFMALYLLYVATESSIGAWETTYLLARGYSDNASASWSAAFWAGIAVGRMLAVPVSARLSPRWMVVLCLGLAVLALLGTRGAGMEPAAFTAAGLALAAIFPTTFAWLTLTFPKAGAVGGLGVGAAMVGGMIGPPLVGLVVARYGAAGVPWAICALALAGLGCALWLHRRT